MALASSRVDGSTSFLERAASWIASAGFRVISPSSTADRRMVDSLTIALRDQIDTHQSKMRHPVQRALVVQAGTCGVLPTIQQSCAYSPKVGTPPTTAAELGSRVFVMIEQVELDQAVYFIAKLGRSFDAFLCRGIGKGLTSASTVPHEAESERSVVKVDPCGEIHWLSSHSSYLFLL